MASTETSFATLRRYNLSAAALHALSAITVIALAVLTK
jgi:hypothetical protein